MTTRRSWFAAATLGLAGLAGTLRVMTADGPLLGFLNDHSTAERALEAQFDARLAAGDLREWMRRLSARPHHVGSAYTRENVDFMAAQFRAWGFETEVEQFDVLFPTPKNRLLEMTAPTRFTATLDEPILAEDTTSSQKNEQLPTYNAYSVDGDVTGALVYVNYGIPEDYEELARRGIDVTGKIVIARYGQSWRGIKPKVAAEHGAIGCLIYSDPIDDGYARGDVYPEGAYRMNQGVQRGSVSDWPTYTGDPLTPNVGAVVDAPRLRREEVPVLTEIPVLPISYGDAQPLLAALGGPVAPDDWRGALPLTYHIGPGPAEVHLKVEFNWDLQPAYDVVARLEGAEWPDEWIVRANHHDAWVNGAADPISGLVAMMAEAKALGELAKTGWRPRRTIIYAAWDGEEPAAIGSTEWAEQHGRELRERAVVYINSDGNGRGFLNLAGSHTLEKFVNEIARDVTDPETGVSVFERRHARQMVSNPRADVSATSDHPLGALGTGSDYTPFLQHLGIASLSLGYGGEGGGGSYHSIFDSFDHYTRFGDPTFAYGVTLAQTSGRAVLRLANADVLPFEFERFTRAVTGYVGEVKALADDMRAETSRVNRLLDDKRYEQAADPTLTHVPPARRDPVPYLNFAPLDNTLAVIDRSARAYTRAVGRLSGGPATAQAGLNALNEVLLGTERALAPEPGLPRRPWYKHVIYAPGFYTGYGVKTLPGVREAIESRNWDEASREIVRLAETLEGFAREIDRATALAGRASH